MGQRVFFREQPLTTLVLKGNFLKCLQNTGLHTKIHNCAGHQKLGTKHTH